MPTNAKQNPPKQATTKPATTETATRAVPMPFYQPEELCQTHAMIVDAVTSILSHGGHRDDVDNLLRVAMSHTRRRTYSDFTSDPAELDKAAREFIQEEFDEWREDITVMWKKNRRPERAKAEVKTITERIQVNTREHVACLFDEFMTKATFEAQVLLLNVLNNHASRSMAAEYMEAENYLASAFEIEIGRNVHHLSVPESIVDDVESYIKAMRAIKKAA